MSSTKFKQDLDVTGNINLSGNITIGGNTLSGDADTDSVTLNADVTSNIVPDADVTYDIGSSTKTWREVFTSKINSATGDDLDIHSGSDIALYPTGNIWIKAQTKLIFEGTVPDDFEAKLQATSVTADRDIILPDASGTLALNEQLQDGTFDLDVNDLTVTGDAAIGGITSANTVAGTFTGSSATFDISRIISNGSSQDITRQTNGGATLFDMTFNNALLHITDGLTGNFTVNVQSPDLNGPRLTPLVVMVSQGATPYVPADVWFDFTSFGGTIIWEGGTPPTGNANALDVFTLMCYRHGTTWEIIGSIKSYS